MDANNETWTRKKVLPVLPASETVNGTDMPVRRFGHSMASGSTFNLLVDSENQERRDVIDRIVMFGGMGLYE